MSDPVIIRVVRPYATVQEYLDAESGTIDSRGMLLVDAAPVPPNALVRFVVSLQSGEALIKAEGRVKEYVPTEGSEPGGLKVRFKRFGGVTKQFIDRAVSHRVASNRPPPADAEVDSSRLPTQITEGEVSTPDAGPPPPPRGQALVDAAAEEGEISGIRNRPIGEVQTPANREQLLDRLRERARKMTSAELAAFSKPARVS